MAQRIYQLVQLSRSFGQKVKWAGLDRISGYHAYHSPWVSKFRYSAPIVGFLCKQVKKIYTGVIGPCLSASGYCSKMPRAVVFGPTKLGGMEWDNPVLIQLYKKIKMLIGSIRLQDTVGKLMRIQLS